MQNKSIDSLPLAKILRKVNLNLQTLKRVLNYSGEWAKKTKQIIGLNGFQTIAITFYVFQMVLKMC